MSRSPRLSPAPRISPLPRRSPRLLAASVALAALLALLTLATAQPAAADSEICEQYGTTTVQGGRYVVGNNRWGTSATQCISVNDRGFRITRADGQTATNGAPKSYPTIYAGCHYGTCSSSEVIGPNGVRVSDSRFASIQTSVSMTYPSSGTYDAAYDIWFHRSQPSATTGQNDGAELMIWLNRQGSIQPIGSKVATVNLAGSTWDVWFGNTGWNVVSYVRTSTAGSVSFSVKTFFDDMLARGYGQSSWYLTSVQAGFEPWIGGTGLAVTDFSVTGNGQPPTQTTPPPTQTTPPPGGSSGSCSATYALVGSWGGGFQANVTVKAGSSGVTGWTVRGTLPSGSGVQNVWNGRSTGSGSSLVVANESYNGSLAPGASTTFGFVGTGNAPSSLALTCG